MNYQRLSSISRLYFGYEDLARALDIAPASARVTANRYVKQGILIRLKRNIYILGKRWEAITQEEEFTLANLIQVPSYVSLMTALDYYGITTQIQRDFVESIALKRTKEVEAGQVKFTFVRMSEKLYTGFMRTKGFFIASPEKAFLDALYLKSLRRYDFDMGSIDFGKMDKNQLKRLARGFPERTRKMLEKYEYSG